MTLTPESISLIDAARGHGHTYDQVHSVLTQALPPDQAHQVLSEYLQTQLPDGRPRGQVNPGDPAEHGVK